MCFYLCAYGQDMTCRLPQGMIHFSELSIDQIGLQQPPAFSRSSTLRSVSVLNDSNLIICRHVFRGMIVEAEKIKCKICGLEVPCTQIS